jgi:hypothetical protein
VSDITSLLDRTTPNDLPTPDIRSLAQRSRRRRARQRRLLASIATVGIATVGAATSALLSSGPDRPDVTTPEVALLGDDAGLEAAPQRLILDDWRELPIAGDPIPLELAGLDPDGAPRPLPGGGHVVVGHHPEQAPPPEGFNEFTDLTYGLAVVGANGEVDVERDIEDSSLLGVTATEAVLARQPNDERGEPSGLASIVAHDLTTGEERVLRQDVTFEAGDNASAISAIVAGDLVTVEASVRTEPTAENASRIVPGSEKCTLRITDLTTGETTERPLAIGCEMLFGLQASPNGSQAAVAYETGGSPVVGADVRLAVLDLPSGAVSHDQLLGHSVDCRAFGDCPPDPRFVDYRGMAWDDASTVRVAMIDPNAGGEDLIVQSIPVR